MAHHQPTQPRDSDRAHQEAREHRRLCKLVQAWRDPQEEVQVLDCRDLLRVWEDLDSLVRASQELRVVSQAVEDHHRASQVALLLASLVLLPVVLLALVRLQVSHLPADEASQAARKDLAADRRVR